jgi:hypothetical protein
MHRRSSMKSPRRLDVAFKSYQNVDIHLFTKTPLIFPRRNDCALISTDCGRFRKLVTSRIKVFDSAHLLVRNTPSHDRSVVVFVCLCGRRTVSASSDSLVDRWLLQRTDHEVFERLEHELGVLFYTGSRKSAVSSIRARFCTGFRLPTLAFAFSCLCLR